MLLLHLLRARPAVVGWLNASGLSFWNRLHVSCEEFCSETGLNLETWLHLMENLPSLPERFDAATAPLYGIVDRLTEEHREFREDSIPAIKRILKESPDMKKEPSALWALQAFELFDRALADHMRVEESSLYPHILWLEARICSPEIPPDAEAPSLKGALKHGHDLEKLLIETARGIRVRIAATTLNGSAKSIRHLIRDLEILEEKLARHSALELLLLGRAEKLERRFSESPENAQPLRRHA